MRYSLTSMGSTKSTSKVAGNSKGGVRRFALALQRESILTAAGPKVKIPG
jgi:hypothetical protein